MQSLPERRALEKALSGRFRLLSPQVEASAGNAIRVWNRAMGGSARGLLGGFV